MARLGFYNGKTGEFEEELSDSVVRMWFTIGLNGIAEGSVTVEDSVSVNDFMSSLRDNSHFLKFGGDDHLYGGVVSSARLDRGIWTVEFRGANGWWQGMDSVAWFLATGGRVDRGSNGGVIVFYAESAIGILVEVFKNQGRAMSRRGWDDSVIDWSQLKSLAVGTPSGEWTRSYRLNSFETPTFARVVDDVISELDSSDYFQVEVDQDLYSDFKFVVKVVKRGKTVSLEEAGGNIFDVSFDYSGTEYKPIGVASGTNLSGESELSVVYDQTHHEEDFVYSTAITPSSSESSNAISSIASSGLVKSNSSFGSLKFSMFLDNIDVLDNVYVDIENVLYSGVVVEKRLEGNIFTYSVDLGSSGSRSLKSAPSVERNLIFNPLNEAFSLSNSNARRVANSSGWRS